MRKVSNMLGPNYFWKVKKLSKIENFKIFGVFLMIFSEIVMILGENWCGWSKEIWERIIK